jgi:hypothetical protein
MQITQLDGDGQGACTSPRMSTQEKPIYEDLCGGSSRCFETLPTCLETVATSRIANDIRQYNMQYDVLNQLPGGPAG